MKGNYKRMMEIIDTTFATRNDPDQLQVTPGQIKKLQAIHPNSLTEQADENGPLIWVLMIPTQKTIMNDFLESKISEKQILERTEPGTNYDCIYLCSATTLPECRGKGYTMELCINAIHKIKEEHNISTLFVWPFTKAGERLAKRVAEKCKLPLLQVKREY